MPDEIKGGLDLGVSPEAVGDLLAQVEATLVAAEVHFLATAALAVSDLDAKSSAKILEALRVILENNGGGNPA